MGTMINSKTNYFLCIITHRNLVSGVKLIVYRNKSMIKLDEIDDHSIFVIEIFFKGVYLLL
jgi:hypothetical protein